MLSLGMKIHPDRWNQEGNCAKGNSVEARDINLAIDRARTKLRQTYDLLDSQHQNVTAAMVKLTYQGKSPGDSATAATSTAPPDRTLMDVTNFVLERKEKRVLKKLMAKGTLTKWNTTKTKLVSFLEETKIKPSIPCAYIEVDLGAIICLLILFILRG